jgi:hypothetical protein
MRYPEDKTAVNNIWDKYSHRLPSLINSTGELEQYIALAAWDNFARHGSAE